jgi:hypothetical protein
VRVVWLIAIGCVQGTETAATPEPKRDAETTAAGTFDAPRLPDWEVTTSGPLRCAEPGESYVHEALDVVDPNMDERRLVGGGLAVGDVDGDGRHDLVVLGATETQLYRGTPSGFARAEGLPQLEGATGGTLVDHDSDGDLDLYVTRWQLPDRLLDNVGGTFVDVTEARGLTGALRSQASAWGDMDGDGDLDLFVGNYGPKPTGGFSNPDVLVRADPNQLWENVGGAFVDRSARIAEAHDGHTFMGAWVDLDRDGDQDLWVVQDFGAARPSRLFRNGPRGLTADPSSGLDSTMLGMGVGIGDVNHDERPDFLVSSFQAAHLFVSREGGWVEEQLARGLDPDGAEDRFFGWGAELADLDNDGDDEAVIGFGRWDEYGLEDAQPDGVWRNDDGQFVQVAETLGLDHVGRTRGLLAVDLDEDGTLDLVRRFLAAPTEVAWGPCADGAWLTVRPRMPGGPNTHGVGARVRVVGPDRVWSRHVAAGTSMYAGGPPEVHVGLGALERVDVDVVWPDGVVTAVGEVQTRQVVEVVRHR